MTNAPVEAHDLVRRFGDVQAVRGVDLTVAEGEVFGFLGPNGAGKSTIVRMLVTLLRPTSGTARVAGFDGCANRIWYVAPSASPCRTRRSIRS